ncbi:MAG TPA: GNAT family N-acetyltransferase [Pseudolabrys sp.]|nr:GNAT family N-acetyltransferase [Pseudolabrys sp.]
MSALPGAPVIRKATVRDTARIISIARAAYAKYIPRMGRDPPPMLADFEALITAGFATVIESAGNVVGYLIAWPEADAYLIDNLAIDPARQGEGFGRKLVEKAIAEARGLNLPALRLYTNVVMTENIALYGHIGFVETHRTVENGLHRMHMRLTL